MVDYVEKSKESVESVEVVEKSDWWAWKRDTDSAPDKLTCFLRRADAMGGYALLTKLVISKETFPDFSDFEFFVLEKFGGGDYLVESRDGNGAYTTKQKFLVEGVQKNIVEPKQNDGAMMLAMQQQMVADNREFMREMLTAMAGNGNSSGLGQVREAFDLVNAIKPPDAARSKTETILEQMQARWLREKLDGDGVVSSSNSDGQLLALATAIVGMIASGKDVKGVNGLEGQQEPVVNNEVEEQEMNQVELLELAKELFTEVINETKAGKDMSEIVSSQLKKEEFQSDEVIEFLIEKASRFLASRKTRILVNSFMPETRGHNDTIAAFAKEFINQAEG